MRYDTLFKPVSADEPCGPDLDEVGDEDFLNYTLSAEDRFPTRYYDIDSGAPVEITIDIRSEVKIVSGLLERSRDLRLLSIEARFQALAGSIVGFSECVQAMAGLLTRFWPNLHPQGYEGDFMLRQNTAGSLNSRPSVVFPLQNAAIVRDRRFGTVTQRSHSIVLGEATAPAGSKLMTASDIAGALGSPDNIAAVTIVHEATGAALQGLREIRDAFVDNSGFEYAPDFDDVRVVLEKIKGLIEAHVPSLAPGLAETAADVDEPVEGEALPDGESPDLAALLTRRSKAPPSKIASRDEAKAALTAAERYFSLHETSSPALILVSQARSLIGKPLVVALQELAPNEADRAVIRIDADSGFQLDMYRMKAVTEQIEPIDGGEAASEEKTFAAATRAEAEALISAVEAFHKVAEPSSPVPMLLDKARGFLNQDFRTILRSLTSR